MLKARLSLSTTVTKILITAILFVGFHLGASPEEPLSRELCLKTMKAELIPVPIGAVKKTKRVSDAIAKSINDVNAAIVKRKKECEIYLQNRFAN